MKVLIAGGTGFIGRALRAQLKGAGHTITLLSRRHEPGAVHWDPGTRTIDAGRLEGFDAVVNLAGESIAGRRWNETHKARLLDSRVGGTLLVAETIATLEAPPRVLLNASAVGYYGDRGDEVLTEESPPGSGFLAELCRQWEEATRPAEKAGVRVVRTRSGIVLGQGGGALKPLMIVFRLGFGGKLGSGQQWFSWISLHDEMAGMQRLLEDEALTGTFNLTSPNPVTNAELTEVLGRVLHRPTIFNVPSAVMKLVLGSEMAEGLLGGQRVLPARLGEAGFDFRHPEIKSALREALGRP